MARSYQNLSEYIQVLDDAEKLVRVTVPVNKDTELHPLVRLQFRGLPEEKRKAFLFENVYDSTGRKYDIPVLVAAMAGSSDIYALGMGCPTEEIPDRWLQALESPLDPVTVESGPCQDVVIKGEQLEKEGLSLLPIPISTPGFDNAPYTSASHWVTKHPETGMHNLGNYRGMVKAPNRIGTLPAMLGVGMRDHIDAWREAGHERLPAAVVIGAPPHVTYTAVTRIPNDMCEYDVAGAIAGKPLELVKCLTQDLMVPAEAEIVIEGTVPASEVEMEGPFGEFPGYMAQRDYSFFMDITCITMRKKPTYLAILSQVPPSESSKMRHIGRAAAAKKFLHDNGFDNVIDVNYLECTGSNALVVIKIKKREADDGAKALDLLTTKFIGKIAVAVDEDIDITSLENIMWAIAWRNQPYRDVKIVDTPLLALDPSLAPPGESRGLATDAGAMPRNTSLMIDATMAWPYPPISLPKREYMERAQELWAELQLPGLELQNPWYGYSLGAWTKELEEEAQLAVEGRHYETGEKLRGRRKRID
ncbi:MAG: UbiD family decarboxylase [Rhodospirillales bacterium]|jgi:UbiD family decarboxylase|nr:UbiD family decarboxylase [Rhodospirillales bacterium]MBT5076634.1 UbiD family decarboxylase [Rhodospirillales bacterium]MBT5114043.1 UbiD family decarboxylase [Rhodospirillales bacterium]MBT5672571.1 UbiD family decarboxylase [Rhodospirillales bacterium]MBT6185759.1 UbiD family decarboxylase [Rhodospirillales bacterium]